MLLSRDYDPWIAFFVKKQGVNPSICLSMRAKGLKGKLGTFNINLFFMRVFLFVQVFAW